MTKIQDILERFDKQFIKIHMDGDTPIAYTQQLNVLEMKKFIRQALREVVEEIDRKVFEVENRQILDGKSMDKTAEISRFLQNLKEELKK